MSGFAYKDGVLTVDGIDLTAIAAEWGTPTYIYSAAAIEKDIAISAIMLCRQAARYILPSSQIPTLLCCGCWPGLVLVRILSPMVR